MTELTIERAQPESEKNYMVFKKKLEDLVGTEINVSGESHKFNAKYCEELRTKHGGLNKSENILEYLDSLAFGNPENGETEKKEKELQFLEEEIKKNSQLRELIASGNTLAECLEKTYSLDRDTELYSHILAGDLGNEVMRKMSLRLSLAKLELCPVFNLAEFEKASELTKDFFLKCVNKGFDFMLKTKGDENRATWDAVTMYNAIKKCMKIGIKVEELYIDKQAIRDFIVDNFFNTKIEQWKSAQPKDINEAIKELDTYLGVV